MVYKYIEYTSGEVEARESECEYNIKLRMLHIYFAIWQ